MPSVLAEINKLKRDLQQVEKLKATARDARRKSLIGTPLIDYTHLSDTQLQEQIETVSASISIDMTPYDSLTVEQLITAYNELL